MSEDRVSGYNQEDAYFHKKDRELLAKKRAQLDAQRSGAAALKCPRCASAMIKVPLEQVKIDRCTSCGGVFLDKGELELLTHGKSGGFFKRLFTKN